jgi:glutaredoxin
MTTTRPKGPSAPPPQRPSIAPTKRPSMVPPARPSVAPAARPSMAPPKRPSTYPVDRRCPVHGLALSPDGRCLRCNTERRPTRRGLEPLLEPTSRLTKLLVALVLACLLGAALVLSSEDEPAPTARGLVVERIAEPPAPAPVEADPALAAAQRESERRAREAAARDTAEAAEAARLQREEAARARAQVPIVLYGTSWCGACRQARSYLLSQGIPFRDLDVETDPAARAEYVRLNPRQTVPTLDVGGSVLTGFSPAAFERALDQAVAGSR